MSEKIEQQSEEEKIELPKTLTQNHFWRALNGEPIIEPSREELENFVQEQIKQNSPPLTELNETEKAVVSQEFLEELVVSTKIGEYSSKKGLINLIKYAESCFFDEEAKKFSGKYHISTQPLSKKQIIELLENSRIWGESRVEYSGQEGPLTSQGIRPIEEYGYSREKVKEAFSTIRKTTGHQKLRVLDVGGGSGYALADMKEIDPDIETINLTIDEEPSQFKVDKLLLLPVELMPAELEETVDFAISRTAFRYFDYPDIALKNVVKALAEGGWADIYFSTERSSLYNFESGKTREEQFKESQEYFKKIEELEYGKRRSWEPVQKEKNEMLEKKIAAENKNNQENREKVEKELDKRVRSVLLWIKQLEKEGYIETNIPNEGQTREKKYYRDTDGFFKIKKLKSIKDLSER